MSDSHSKEESEARSTTLTDETLESGKYLTESEKMYEIIVAGGEFKKSVEHILMPAILPREKNVLARLWSAIFSKKASNINSQADQTSSILKWSYLKPMKTRREVFMTGIYKDQMFAFGGLGSGRSLETLELNDPRARWQHHSEFFQQDLWASAAVMYGDSAYIFGGSIGGAASSNIYRLGLVSPYTFDLIGQMPEPRSYHNAEIFDDKVIILCGSSTGFSNALVDTVLQYDITSNSFKTLPPLPVKVIYAATARWKDNAVIVGGQGECFGSSTVWLYNISSGESRRLQPMRQKRESCAAVVAGDMLVVMGGQNAEEVNLASAECYDFLTNKWRELPRMKQGRRYPSAVVRCWNTEKVQVDIKDPQNDKEMS